ncbi:hypothetical protein [Herbaspirillum sp. NPDC101396]|uniref:hypothetical protein n=1 Tax=Herbaspirillum sp. NPDC101396 TaxID=3364005 RepID=UPI00383BCA31
MLPEKSLVDRLLRGSDGKNQNDQFSENAELSDAELYRIVVADLMRSGIIGTKADFDAEVRRTCTLATADEIIRFRERRPGCKAWLSGKKMICECGNVWSLINPQPPHCKTEPQ